MQILFQIRSIDKLNNNGAIKKTVMKSYIALICISNFISVSTIVIQEETQELIDGGEKIVLKCLHSKFMRFKQKFKPKWHCSKIIF